MRGQRSEYLSAVVISHAQAIFSGAFPLLFQNLQYPAIQVLDTVRFEVFRDKHGTSKFILIQFTIFPLFNPGLLFVLANIELRFTDQAFLIPHLQELLRELWRCLVG
jgi:hypothetical protein